MFGARLHPGMIAGNGRGGGGIRDVPARTDEDVAGWCGSVFWLRRGDRAVAQSQNADVAVKP